MFLIVRADGKFWDGYGWNVRGKIFCSVGKATRSLHEEGESTESTSIIPLEILNHDTSEELPAWGP